MPQDPTECPADDGGLQRPALCAPVAGAGKTTLAVCALGLRDLLLGGDGAPVAAFQRPLWILKSFTPASQCLFLRSLGSWGFLEPFIGMKSCLVVLGGLCLGGPEELGRPKSKHRSQDT